jgi:nicotinamide-nucleotide amidase
LRVFALPGVPAELRDMWREAIRPTLLAALGAQRRAIRHRRINCFGVGESDLEQMLPDLVRRGRHPAVGITASKATITLRITAEGDSPEACDAAIEPIVTTIRQCLGPLVFGEGDEELHHVVVRRLGDRRETLGTVEWGLSGLLANWLSEAAEGSAVYGAGLVAGDALAAGRLLDLPPALLVDEEAGSRELMVAMAEACRQRCGVIRGLAVGPIVERGSGPSAAVALHYALASPSRVAAESSPFVGHPDLLKARGAKQALNFVRLALL